jgi:hypothetical protein
MRENKNSDLKYALLLQLLPPVNESTHLVSTLIVAGVQTGRLVQVSFTCRRI